jgi:hypothetical protein
MFKEALLKQKNIAISEIKEVKFPREKLLEIIKTNGSLVKIRLDLLSQEDRKSLKDMLIKLTDPTLESLQTKTD